MFFQCLLSKKLPVTYVHLIQIFCQVTEIWLCEMQKLNFYSVNNNYSHPVITRKNKSLNCKAKGNVNVTNISLQSMFENVHQLL